jgi:hypothetical protein
MLPFRRAAKYRLLLRSDRVLGVLGLMTLAAGFTVLVASSLKGATTE